MNFLPARVAQHLRHVTHAPGQSLYHRFNRSLSNGVAKVSNRFSIDQIFSQFFFSKPFSSCFSLSEADAKVSPLSQSDNTRSQLSSASAESELHFCSCEIGQAQNRSPVPPPSMRSFFPLYGLYSQKFFFTKSGLSFNSFRSHLSPWQGDHNTRRTAQPDCSNKHHQGT